MGETEKTVLLGGAHTRALARDDWTIIDASLGQTRVLGPAHCADPHASLDVLHL
jgi:hypothetical protein